MCDQAINAQYKIYRSELEKARDKGAPYQKQCDQLIGFAEKHAKKQLKDAREGCMEAQFSRFNTLARERIQKYTRLKKMYLPAYCRIKYLKQFENMKNAYIKKGFDELVHSCYHEFGAAILKKQVPLMKKTCTISHLLPGFSRYKITSNILLPLLEKARTICSQGK
ncbi:hypothetical protein KKF84_13935 [Myxococcota bacterium]|nr:hypothetical protein [Myxococcota bacterium]